MCVAEWKAMRPGILIALLLQVHRGQPSQFAIQLISNSDGTKFWFVQSSVFAAVWDVHASKLTVSWMFDGNTRHHQQEPRRFTRLLATEVLKLHDLHGRCTVYNDGPRGVMAPCFVWKPHPAVKHRIRIELNRDFVVRRTEHHLIKNHYISAVKQKQCLS